MARSVPMAFQYVIMIMIITRVLDLYDAGVFTLAYASANLFLILENIECVPFRYLMLNANLHSVTIEPQE